MTVSHSRQQTAVHGELWSQNENIVSRIQDGDADAYQDLWNANKRLVAHYALCYLPLVERRPGIDFDDLMQAGYIGLHMAAGEYDPEHGVKFSTYATFYIKREMRREAGINGRRDPMDMAYSLDAPLISGDERSKTLGDTLPADDGTGSFEAEELRKIVRTAMMRMIDDGIRCALWERHWNKKTDAQTADKYGIPIDEMRGLIQV